MSVAVGRTASGETIWRENDGTCWVDDGWGGYFVNCPSGSGGGYANQLPTMQSPTMTTGGAPIQSGGSWLNDLLNTFIYSSALYNNASHIPTTAHQTQTPVQQVINPYPQGSAIPQNSLGASAGANLGGSIQDFISKNSTLLLVAGVGLVLYKMNSK